MISVNNQEVNDFFILQAIWSLSPLLNSAIVA